MPSYQRGSSRGSASAGRKGGGNAVAYLAAGIVMALLVVVFVSMSKKKSPATPDKPAPAATAPTPPPAATKPGEPPYPVLSAALQQEGIALAKTFEKDLADADRIYKESLKAKEAGNDAEWQSKLREVRDLADGVNRTWNDFVAKLPSSKDYDEEQVARRYFYKEVGLVAKAGKLLAAMKSDLR